MRIRWTTTSAVAGALAGLLLPLGTAASANTYTVRWTWEVPHVAVASPAAFTIAVGDVIVTEEDLRSERAMGLVGVLTVTVEVAGTASPPVGNRATCVAGDGVVLTLPDVAGSTHVEASFVRDGTLEVLAGPHRTGTGSGEPITFAVCGPAGSGPVVDVLVGPAPDDPDPDPQPEPRDQPTPAPCAAPPRADEAGDRGSPCPPTREDRTARGERPEH